MFYVYWQKNIKSLIKLQTDGTQDLKTAEIEADQIANVKRSGSIIVIKIWGYVPVETWTMKLMKNYRTISHRNAKSYLSDYRLEKHNGKNRWVKTNPKQTSFFDE